MTTGPTLACTHCKEHKPLDQFSACTRFTRGYQYWCKVCMTSYKAEPKTRVVDRVRQRRRRERADEERLLRKKGITWSTATDTAPSAAPVSSASE